MASSDYDAALAGSANQGRVPMGKDGVAFSSPSAEPKSGTLVGKKGAQAGDPAATGVGVRSNVQYAGERKGAAYSIKASYLKQTSPEAGATQANGRIVSPSVIRSKDSFWQGNSTSY